MSLVYNIAPSEDGRENGRYHTENEDVVQSLKGSRSDKKLVLPSINRKHETADESFNRQSKQSLSRRSDKNDKSGVFEFQRNPVDSPQFA